MMRLKASVRKESILSAVNSDLYIEYPCIEIAVNDFTYTQGSLKVSSINQKKRIPVYIDENKRTITILRLGCNCG